MASTRIKQAFDHAAGSRIASRIGRQLSRGQLRVLAYHAVADSAVFERQMRHLVRHYTPVSGRAVAAAFRERQALPSDAVWVTFDDGDPSIVDCGQPVLDHLGVPATLFACPGVIETGQPFWWAVVQAALDLAIRPELDGRQWADARLITHLKGKPDRDRRAFVADLQARLRMHGTAPASEQLQRSHLVRWTSSGHDVGNHTWDHPCLDRCEPEEQVVQVRRADEWLRSNVPAYSPLFAYPNGNWSPIVEDELRALGYMVAVMFDHRLDGLIHPLRISRLRVSADAPLRRFAAIISGVHPATFALMSHFRFGTATCSSPSAVPPGREAVC